MPASELPAAINGAVVGLAVAPEGRLQTYQHTLNSAADAAPLPCLGLGIVRSLDVAAGLLFLLTPLGQADLERVNTLQVLVKPNGACLHDQSGFAFCFV